MAGAAPSHCGDDARLHRVQGDDQDVSDTSAVSFPPQVKWISAETGWGVFATRPYQTGDHVLWEPPWVFAQSYKTWNTRPAETRSRASTSVCARDSSPSPQTDIWAPSADSTGHSEWTSGSTCIPVEGAATKEQLERLRCCFGCGAPLLAFLREECDRIDGVLQAMKQNEGMESGNTSPKNVCESGTRMMQAPVPATWDLILDANVQHLAQTPGDASAEASPPAHTVRSAGTSAAAAASSRPYVTEVDVAGRQHCVYFCMPACEKRGLMEEGKRLVLASPPHSRLSMSRPGPEGAKRDAPSGAAGGTALTPSSAAQTPLVSLLRYPTPDAVVGFAQHPPPVALRLKAWPTRLHVLSSLHSVARRCNERVWLLTLLLAKHQHCTLTSASAAGTSPPQPRRFVAWLRDTVAPNFRIRLEEMLRSYAEGAMHLLSMEQRALLKFTWHLLTWWWLLCSAEEYTAIATVATGASVTLPAWPPFLDPHHAPLEQLSSSSPAATSEAQVLEWVTGALSIAQSTAFPLQLYLQLYWLTNANAHMYIVASPLYTLWCRWLQSKADCGDAATVDAPTMTSHKEGTTAPPENSVKLLERLCALFHKRSVGGVDAALGAEVAHGSGEEDSLHAAGVALYAVAARLNHSCVPNVCFQPTMGPVAASVVALRSIEAGEQLFTSYIRVEDFGEQTGAAAARRRRYLKDHYGFDCGCALCLRSQNLPEKGREHEGRPPHNRPPPSALSLSLSMARKRATRQHRCGAACVRPPLRRVTGSKQKGGR
ncbi:hypothetical protein LSCM1_05135 [Leishmania martiniquensis]|uniref:SET domain-containing protein n=1 Tax=Leishmania martiniquensis TaxID=1580590 RepID=A0A836KTN8_9TRYP|nr:hypothetical protein LSCM1_05135 [Leishmania martiniquensis]